MSDHAAGICLFCGGKLASVDLRVRWGVAASSSGEVTVGPVQEALLRELLAAGQPLTASELIPRVWAGGGPLTAVNCIANAVRLLNVRLKPTGYLVVNSQREAGMDGPTQSNSGYFVRPRKSGDDE